MIHPMRRLTSHCSALLQPYVDFGLKLLGADAMAIPGLYRFVQVILSLSKVN